MDASVESEKAFAQRLRDLDQTAWTALFETHHERLWRYAFARTGDTALADDIAAQTFAEALESIDRFRYRGKPVIAWLYRIARNQLGKRLRTAKREAVHRPPEPTSDPMAATLDSILLSKALSTLTRDQADAVVLRYYAGYSTPEIADAMGKSKSAVYSLEIRAMAALRRYLESG